VAHQPADSGFKKVDVLKGGWKQWNENKYPVEKK
jgi:3-mercaptopyruvate sulfurtransferase SseA